MRSVFIATLVATTVMMSACQAPRIKPLAPPIGKALLKVSETDPVPEYTFYKDPRLNQSCEKGFKISVCDADGVPLKPLRRDKYATQYEVNEKGTEGRWDRAYVLEPGPVEVHVYPGVYSCPKTPTGQKVGAGIGSFVGGGFFGLSVQTAAKDDFKQVLSFEALSSQSYWVDCDLKKFRWVWVTPEEER